MYKDFFELLSTSLNDTLGFAILAERGTCMYFVGYLGSGRWMISLSAKEGKK